MATQLLVVSLASSARHWCLQDSNMEHRDGMHEVLERAATRWRDQVVGLAVTGIDHVLQNLCKHKEEGDGAGPSSARNAI